MTVLISIYILLLSLRIILSWFQHPDFGAPWRLLVRLTNPYLSLFSGIRFLRQGMFDFTPLAAILCLVVVLNVLQSIERFGRITAGVFNGEGYKSPQDDDGKYRPALGVQVNPVEDFTLYLFGDWMPVGSTFDTPQSTIAASSPRSRLTPNKTV